MRCSPVVFTLQSIPGALTSTKVRITDLNKQNYLKVVMEEKD